MSEQDDFFLDVERAVAEFRKMNVVPEIPEVESDGKDFEKFQSELKELNKLSKKELEQRWNLLQDKKSKAK
jgi:hypothetical protein